MEAFDKRKTTSSPPEMYTNLTQIFQRLLQHYTNKPSSLAKEPLP